MRLRESVGTLIDELRGQNESSGACGCEPIVQRNSLVVDADRCSGRARFASHPQCRATLVDALPGAGVDHLVVTFHGEQRRYGETAVSLFQAAAAFVCTDGPEAGLRDLARLDPLAAADELERRRETSVGAAGKLVAFADRRGYHALLSPTTGLALSNWRVDPELPPEAVLMGVRELPSGATVRRYQTPACDVPRYHLRPREAGFGRPELAVLARARSRLADERTTEAAHSAAETAVREFAQRTHPVGALIDVLEKHTGGLGLLEDLFADPRVSDVFVTAPATSNCVRVRVDGETLTTNVRLTRSGVGALASRFRRESGRAFARATPTLDAATTVAGRRIRVAGVTDPVSDGYAFAFRAHDRQVWRLLDLVANESLSPPAAATLSLAVRRGRSVLVTGARGTGKTTLLGALLWELPDAVRTVLIEDTPELPLASLQADGRDVQRFLAGEDAAEVGPTDALRTALRMGDGALVVGEIRGAEAGVLYEAMRVGANSEAVLGTVHGDGARAAYERVVDDLGVNPAAFGETDLVVTTARDVEGNRYVRAVEEVDPAHPDAFEPLFERADGTLGATGRIERGNSHLLAAVARDGETYRDVLTQLQRATERVRATDMSVQETT